jgi:hypothetical protein
MAIDTFPLLPKASISLALMANAPKENRGRAAAIRAAGMLAFDAPRRAAPPPQRAAVIVEARDPGEVADRVGDAKIEQLSENFLSVEGDVGNIANVTQLPQVRRVQTKKVSQMHLNEALPDIGLIAPQAGPRPVAEVGTGVVVGIVDSGFDLSHPMFRDRNHKLRVDALLDQTLPQPREFTTAQLERGWAGNSRPGADDNGHGTHVASIAAGSRFRRLEGVAPGARLILVKTNFLDTDIAASWIFSKAGNRPCVINLSLGHHYGAHDGTDAEELLHTQLTGPGKVIVISAGNEREDDIHIGGRFHKDQSEDVVFDVQRQPDGSASAVLTLWHDRSDRFSISLITPAGNTITEPSLGHASRATFGAAVIDIGQQRFQPGKAIQHQIGIDMGVAAHNNQLRGWRVRLTCRKATIGRSTAGSTIAASPRSARIRCWRKPAPLGWRLPVQAASPSPATCPKPRGRATSATWATIAWWSAARARSAAWGRRASEDKSRTCRRLAKWLPPHSLRTANSPTMTNLQTAPNGYSPSPERAWQPLS